MPTEKFLQQGFISSSNLELPSFSHLHSIFHTGIFEQYAYIPFYSTTIGNVRFDVDQEINAMLTCKSGGYYTNVDFIPIIGSNSVILPKSGYYRIRAHGNFTKRNTDTSGLRACCMLLSVSSSGDTIHERTAESWERPYSTPNASATSFRSTSAILSGSKGESVDLTLDFIAEFSSGDALVLANAADYVTTKKYDVSFSNFTGRAQLSIQYLGSSIYSS